MKVALTQAFVGEMIIVWGGRLPLFLMLVKKNAPEEKLTTKLDLIKDTLNVMRFRKDGVWVYEVTERDALCDIVIPFFDHFVMHSLWKKRDLEIFRAICVWVRSE